MPKAVLDLGSNTFHILIFEGNNILFKKSKAAKIGLGGFSNETLSNEAMERGMDVLREYNRDIESFKIEKTEIYAIGTSALRIAQNASIFTEMVKNDLGYEIEIIDGNKEAELIYLGTKKAVEITEPSLIMDIGGGSVEFIICDRERKLWQKSFEIGGLRLMEKFMNKDPLPLQNIEQMNHYFEMVLKDLHNAVHQYQPISLIGSSGSFETFYAIYHQEKYGTEVPNQTGFEYPIEAFYTCFEKMVFHDRAYRLQVPGMIPLRVDMIVVAAVLVAFVLKQFDLKKIKISDYALLEGAWEFYKK
jgi:exopolyphosphatase / guanosine-5'-triphosphate,3'-diphosphate pyrophosphatase